MVKDRSVSEVAPNEVLIYVDTVAIVGNGEAFRACEQKRLVAPIRLRNVASGDFELGFGVEIRGPSRLTYWPTGCPCGESPVHIAIVADESTVFVQRKFDDITTAPFSTKEQT